MHRGRVVEYGPAGEIFTDPKDDYTRSLFAAARVADRLRRPLGLPLGRVQRQYLARCGGVRLAAQDAQVCRRATAPRRPPPGPGR